MFLACGQKKEQQTSSETTSENALTTYYLIRHAEKDRSDPENQDPYLTEAGIARAKNWAGFFDSIPLDQIYSTGYHRTQQTASYTASEKGLQLEIYDPGDLYNQDFQLLTKGQRVLVVGHSNTTPELVNKIINQDTYATMSDDDNASLYVVRIKGEVAKVKVLQVN
ncbi:MAG: histidine phosphatase family protein [Bacteroidia bacterium]|nr:histidine phosphatase family protein [Bacteroidia bacterium]